MADLLQERTGERFWTMWNGYLRSDSRRLEKLRSLLLDDSFRESLKELLRIGVTWDAEVVRPQCDAATTQRVSQAWCSAVPAGSIGEKSDADTCRACTYQDWEPLARLVLEATYEATLLAGVVNASRTGNPKVLLCFVGGGVFGNPTEWIVDAINVALRAVVARGMGCEVIVNHYQQVNSAVASAIGVDAPAFQVANWTHNCGGGDLSLSNAIA
jgi:hypothetical protein